MRNMILLKNAGIRTSTLVQAQIRREKISGTRMQEELTINEKQKKTKIVVLE